MCSLLTLLSPSDVVIFTNQEQYVQTFLTKELIQL